MRASNGGTSWCLPTLLALPQDASSTLQEVQTASEATLTLLYELLTLIGPLPREVL